MYIWRTESLPSKSLEQIDPPCCSREDHLWVPWSDTLLYLNYRSLWGYRGHSCLSHSTDSWGLTIKGKILWLILDMVLTPLGSENSALKSSSLMGALPFLIFLGRGAGEGHTSTTGSRTWLIMTQTQIYNYLFLHITIRFMTTCCDNFGL